MRAKFSASVVAGDVRLADALRFLERFLRPDAGQYIVGFAAFGQKVHRDHRELQRRAALKKQHAVVVGNARELSHVGFGAEDYFVKRF